MTAEHLGIIRELPCCVCGRLGVEAHHPRGGSMAARGVNVGAAQRASDWLALPLCTRHHTQEEGIHRIGVDTWEERYGEQAGHIDTLCRLFRKDLWQLAEQEQQTQRAERKWKRPKKLQLGALN